MLGAPLGEVTPGGGPLVRRRLLVSTAAGAACRASAVAVRGRPEKCADPGDSPVLQDRSSYLGE